MELINVNLTPEQLKKLKKLSNDFTDGHKLLIKYSNMIGDFPMMVKKSIKNKYQKNLSKGKGFRIPILSDTVKMLAGKGLLSDFTSPRLTNMGPLIKPDLSKEYTSKKAGKSIKPIGKKKRPRFMAYVL